MMTRRLFAALLLGVLAAVPARAQITLSEEAAPAQATSGTTCTTNSVTAASGALLTVTIGRRGSNTISSVSGSLNGAFTLTVDNPPGTEGSAIYHYIGSASGTETVTVTLGQTVEFGVICALQEWTPTGTASVDATGTNDDATSPYAASAAGITTSSTAALVISVYGFNSSMTTKTCGDGFTALQDGSFRYMACYDTTAVASQSGVDGEFTADQTTVSTAGSIASFADSGGGGGGGGTTHLQRTTLGVGAP